jgi:hypothetical protein
VFASIAIWVFLEVEFGKKQQRWWGDTKINDRKMRLMSYKVTWVTKLHGYMSGT